MASRSELRSPSRTARKTAAEKFPAARLAGFAKITAILAFVLIVLTYLGALTLQVRGPLVEITLAPAAMVENGGFAFTVPLSPLRFPYSAISDDVANSSLTLREDNHPIGPGHALHQDIRDLGEGRYSHWHDTLYFSSTDHSDPRNDGRIYTASYQAVVSPFLVNALSRVEVILCAILAGCVLFLALPRNAQGAAVAVKVALGVLFRRILAELLKPVRRNTAKFPAARLAGLARNTAILAFVLIVLSYLGALALHVREPLVEITLAPADMVENGGFAFTIPLSPLRFPYSAVSDDVADSSLTLREDNHAVGPGHALHQDIRDLGEGRYSHWHDTLYFSSTDHSDPRNNGRIYTASYQAVVSPLLVNALSRVEVILCAVLAGCLLFLAFPRNARGRAEAVKVRLGVLFRWILAELLKPVLRNMAPGKFPAARLAGLARSTAILAFVLIVLTYLGALALHLRSPLVEIILAPADMVENGGFAFAVPLSPPHFPYSVLSDGEVASSSLTLLEDNHPVGPAHAVHQKIRDLGEGQYSHWHDTLYFSSTDHSDPRNNGRIYTASYRGVVSPFLVNALSRVEVILCAILAGCVLFLALPRTAQRPAVAMKVALGVLFLCILAELLNPVLVQRLIMLPWVTFIVLYLGHRFLVMLSRIGSEALPTAPRVAEPNIETVSGGAARTAQNVSGISFWFSHSAHEQDKVRHRLGISTELFCTAVAAALFLYFGPFEIYPATGWIDPAIYQGYFKHYDFNVSITGLTYFAERFAFIVPGVLLFGSLPLEWAHYGLAALPFVIIAASLFYVVRCVAGRPLSVAALSLVCVNTLIVGSVGQGYVGGILLACLFAGFAWLYGSALGSDYRLPCLAAGCCFGVAVFTNPIAVFYLPGMLGALLIAFPHTREAFFARLTWGSAGGVIAAIGFGLTSKIFNGSFDFVTPAIKQIEGDSFTLFQIPLGTWAPFATRLWYAVIVALGGVTVLLRSGRTPESEQRPAFSLLGWAVLSLMAVAASLVYSDAFLGTAYLTYWFHSSYLVVYTTVISSAMLALSMPPGIGRLGRNVVCLICICGALLAVLLPLATRGVDPDHLHLGAVSLIGGAASILALWLAGDRRIRVPEVQAGLAALAVVIPLLILNLNPDTRHVFVYQDPGFRDAALTANEADDFIIGSLHGRTPFFWYDRNEYSKTAKNSVDFNLPSNGHYPGWFRGRRYTGILDQIWGHYYTELLLGLDDTTTVPNWDVILRQKTHPTAIVVLSHDQGDGDRVIQSARRLYGAELVLIDHKLIAHGSFTVHVWVLDVEYAGDKL